MEDRAIKDAKKQHFVPKFYLKCFADDHGLLQVLDVQNGRLGSPRPFPSVCYSHYFYAGETGVADQVSQQIEDWLQHLENAVARELPRIVDTILNMEHIDNKDRYILSVLMSMLWLRTPRMREQVNKMQEDFTKQVMRFRIPEQMDRFLKETGTEMTDEEKEKALKIIETGAYELDFNNVQHLWLMTKNLGFGGPGFANMFFGQKWKIYIAKGKRRFITSDNPVVEWWPTPTTIYGADFLSRNKYFALTPEILFELTYPVGSTKAKRVTLFQDQDDKVMMFNILLAEYSGEFAYSKDKSIFEAMIAGRSRWGKPERDYYEKFEQTSRRGKE